MQKDKKVAFYTLGCKLNFAETSTISREFQKQGFTKVSFNSPADCYVINTCSVTELADKKCRNIIRKAIKTNPNAIIIAIGCYAQLNPGEIEKIKGVDLILGTREKFKIFDYLKEGIEKGKPSVYNCPIEEVNSFNGSFSVNERTRAFLKVQDGCDYKCSYCTIPLARGKSRNIEIQKIVGQARQIASKNILEIVLTGVNIGDFGKTTGENFLQLIKELDAVENIERYRISSIEPNLLSNEIIRFVNQSERFAPHFHIPLQSGCNKILALMKRRYNRELFEDRVNLIKQINPLACIGADVIVGFPGETEEDFEDTFHFISNMDLSYLHVFAFSERKNTQAAQMKNKVDKKVKEQRSKRLIELSVIMRKKFYKNNIGKISKVIFEGKNDRNKITGFTDNYIKVETEYKKRLVDTCIKCELIGLSEHQNMKIKIIE